MATDRKPKQTKIYGMSEIEFDRLDPDNIIASFRVKIPEDCKMFGKCVNKKDIRETCRHVYIQPSTDKLLATNTKVLAIADVVCNGQWPDDEEKITNDVAITKRFVAPIDADAVSKYAGQEIDVVVYKQDYATATLATSKTAIHVISAVQIPTAINYPDWRRVWFKDEQCTESIRLTPDALKQLRDYLNKNKVKKEQQLEISITPQADNVQFSLWERGDNDELQQTCPELCCDLCSGYPKHNIHMTFAARLFAINIMDGFNGEIRFNALSRPIKFCGGQRESILMPMYGERDKFSD